MRKLILIGTIILGALFTANAQVGIGNATPESTSVLDLSNSTSKGLLLPVPAGVASMSNSTGILYFYNDNIYYRRGDGFNALSPWKFKFNGNITNHVYYNLGGNIGIGLSDISISPLAPLQIETDVNLDLVDDGSFLIGTTTSTSLAFNSTHIQTRDTGSSSDLQINEQGGDVTVGSPAVPATIKATKKVQELHQPTGEYYDLLPTGTIVMWYGSTGNIPTGWAMCDGGNYARSDNNDSILTPDLSGRFVVAAGSNGGANYSAHVQGGQDSVALSVAEMPSHNHSGSTSTGGSHTHQVKGKDAAKIDADNSDDKKDASIKNDDEKDSYNEPTAAGGSHNHSFSTNNVGGNTAHENRPKYYALIYIMKL